MATNQGITFINSQIVVILKRGKISSSKLVTSLFNSVQYFPHERTVGISKQDSFGKYIVSTFLGRETLLPLYKKPGH